MTSPFKPLNKLEKLGLKFSDKRKYKLYKWQLREHLVNSKRQEKLNALLAKNEILNPDKIINISKVKGQLNIIHSGNAGDIIFSMPTIKSISKLINVPINLYLLLDQPHNLNPNYTHPLGNVTLNRKMAEMLIPLIKSQEYIADCLCYKDEEIDVKLDLFRELPIWLDKGNIIRWYTYTTGIIPNTSEPWLKVDYKSEYADKVVIARSERYRNPHINYNFLNGYKNLYFLGVESEYLDIKKSIRDIQFIEVQDFNQMASIISSCAFFIGNQSFPYSIAEALKIPRILETSFEAPNVIPDGNNGYDFYLQEHFEWIVRHLFEIKILNK